MKKLKPPKVGQENSLGYFIKESRFHKNLTLDSLARLLGSCKQQLYDVENNICSIPWHWISNLAVILDISKDELALRNLKTTASYKNWEKITKNLHA